MEFFESAFSGKNSWWRYVVIIIGAFLASNVIGAIPIFIITLVKAASDPSAVAELAEATSPLASLGVDPILGLAVLLFPFIVGLAFIILVFKPLHWRNVTTVFSGRSKIRWSRILFSAMVWFAISGVYLVLYKQLDPSNFVLSNVSVTLLYLAIVALLMIPFQAAFEEVVFRGYLMQGLAVLTRNRWIPLLATSVIFALLHSINPEIERFGFWTMMPQYFTFGLIFAITVVMDEGIEIAIGAHAANNIFLSVFVTFDSAALETPAMYEQINIYPWKELGGMVIMSVIFLALMGAMYGWTKWTKVFKPVEVPASNNSDQVP